MQKLIYKRYKLITYRLIFPRWFGASLNQNPHEKRQPPNKMKCPRLPDGRKEARNIYADTKEECVIAEMKAEVAAESKRLECVAKASCRDKNLVSVCAGR